VQSSFEIIVVMAARHVFVAKHLDGIGDTAQAFGLAYGICPVHFYAFKGRRR